MRQFRTRVRQRGQALIYGIFVLLGALAATFFVFNTGQLSAEKTKLVNTADAVAYSAGVLHARALNFTAYTNRAMVANEVTIAQMVSLASWAEYSDGHAQDVFAMYCQPPYYTSVPAVHTTIEYGPLCIALTEGGGIGISAAAAVVDTFAQIVAEASNVSNIGLQAAQAAMFADFVFAREELLQQVADANYTDNGRISVDNIPLTDHWSMFDNGPFISHRSGDERTRMRDLVVQTAARDSFVNDRSWLSKSIVPCLPFVPTPYGEARRTGGTRLHGFDSWEANDHANFRTGRYRLFRGCRMRTLAELGDGEQTAGSGGWRYDGIPNFFDLSDEALGYTPDNGDVNKRDPRLRFAIRVTRDRDQQRISAGTSAVRPTGRLGNWAGNQRNDKMAAVATSEVFFDRKDPNPHGTELPSLFNPYWQVHLVSDSAAVTAALTRN